MENALSDSNNVPIFSPDTLKDTDFSTVGTLFTKN